jgi:hypothetical protein
MHFPFHNNHYFHSDAISWFFFSNNWNICVSIAKCRSYWKWIIGTLGLIMLLSLLLWMLDISILKYSYFCLLCIFQLHPVMFRDNILSLFKIVPLHMKDTALVSTMSLASLIPGSNFLWESEETNVIGEFGIGKWLCVVPPFSLSLLLGSTWTQKVHTWFTFSYCKLDRGSSS